MKPELVLPFEIDSQIDPTTEKRLTTVRVMDSVVLYSEKSYITDDAASGIYMALVHAIAVTRQVHQSLTKDS